MSIIEVENLSRSFKVTKREKSFLKYLFHRQYTNIKAVNNISFSIEEGEIIGLIGPNGAGKSTVIKMMVGILVPTSGKIEVLGKIPHINRKANVLDIGVVFGQRSQLWWDLPVFDTFKLLKKVYEISDSIFEKNYNYYGNLLGVEQFIMQPVRQLSLGQRMRADLCASLLHNPKIIFLDEPTIGLDVVVKKQIHEIIREINKERGITVILTTHDMKDIKELCQRIIMIDRGKIVIDKSVEYVLNHFCSKNIMEVIFDTPPVSFCLNKEVTIEWLSDINIKIYYAPNKITSKEIISEITSKYKILDISIKESDIDDVIRNLYVNSFDLEIFEESNYV